MMAPGVLLILLVTAESWYAFLFQKKATSEILELCWNNFQGITVPELLIKSSIIHSSDLYHLKLHYVIKDFLNSQGTATALSLIVGYFNILAINA